MPETADEPVLVCILATDPLVMPTNILGECMECGAKVQFRPHVPAGKRICIECAVDDLDETEAEFAVTKETLREVYEHFNRKRH